MTFQSEPFKKLEDIFQKGRKLTDADILESFGYPRVTYSFVSLDNYCVPTSGSTYVTIKREPLKTLVVPELFAVVPWYQKIFRR
jgi:hypothetical protein